MACHARCPRATATSRSAGRTSVVETACPLDCPDACSLDVTVQHGKVRRRSTARTRNPVTDGYICAKVRRFGERVYGPDRLLYPAVRKGRKGEGRFRTRLLGRRARTDRRADGAGDAATWGGESILPYSYGGSNGLLTQDNLDATLWRRFGTSRLARTVCAAPTGAANMALYGKMPSVTYEDYPDAKLIILWGVNPVGVRHPPRALRPRGAEARRQRRGRSTRARRRSRAPPTMHLAVQAGHRRRRRARHASLPVRERACRRGVPARRTP